jgi:hypothetical protein
MVDDEQNVGKLMFNKITGIVTESISKGIYVI